MEEQTLDLSDYLNAFKRRRTSILLIAVSIFIIGALVALMWPPTYTSSATILIKEQDIPSEMVQSTVTSFASQRIQAISQKVMARPNLMEIIKKYDLYTGKRARLTTEQIVEEMRENVALDLISADVVDPRTGRPTSATIAFHLSFSSENPRQAQAVANELMSLYLKENIKERSEKANETQVFLSNESDRLSKEIAKLDEKLAKFKEQHVNTLPELQQLNLKLMENTEREIADVDNQIRSQEQTKIYLISQLAQLEPFSIDVMMDPKTRLQMLRTEHLALVARYSKDHPDVIRIEREINGMEIETGQIDTSAEQLRQIEAVRGELAALRKKYSAEHPDVLELKRRIKILEDNPPIISEGKTDLISAATDNPDNPAYIQIKTQIEASDNQIRSLNAKKSGLKDKRAKYEQRLIKTPQVERNYLELQRELNLTMVEYREIHTKLVTAEIAHELEKDSKGERFEIIDPPILPEKPVSPNRPAILFLSLVLALGCGIGYAAAAESLNSTVRGSRGVSTAAGAVPLAIIPYMANDTEIKQRKRRGMTRVTAAAAAVILAVAMTHYFWKPLDVLWYKALRKADVVINT